MGGRPGVLSARYPGATYAERFANIWREMAASGRADRRARFVCAIALATPDAVIFEARGTVEGEILAEARGAQGFGYDPIFFEPGAGKGPRRGVDGGEADGQPPRPRLHRPPRLPARGAR